MSKNNFSLIRVGLFIAGMVILFAIARRLGKEVTIEE